jgi:hypothetical protein
VQWACAAHGLKPRPFKPSNNPPEHPFVLPIDEKSQIPALDFTQPGLSARRGCFGTMTHDYMRLANKPFAAFEQLTRSAFKTIVDIQSTIGTIPRQHKCEAPTLRLVPNPHAIIQQHRNQAFESIYLKTAGVRYFLYHPV